MESITYSWFVSELDSNRVDFTLIVYKNGIENSVVSIDYIFTEYQGDKNSVQYTYKNPVNMTNNTELTTDTIHEITFCFSKIQAKSDVCEEFFFKYPESTTIYIDKFIGTNYYYKGDCYRKQILTANEGIFYANDVELYNDFTVTESNVFACTVILSGYTLTCRGVVTLDNDDSTSCTIKNGTFKDSTLKINNNAFLIENVVLRDVSLQLSENTILYLNDTLWNTRPVFKPFKIYGHETFKEGFMCDTFPSTINDSRMTIQGPVCKKDGTAISLE